MKISRNESGQSLIKKLAKLEYVVTRHKGSHIRLTRVYDNIEHHITIPNHDPIKIGTLSKIIHDIANQLEISREELISLLNE